MKNLSAIRRTASKQRLLPLTMTILMLGAFFFIPARMAMSACSLCAPPVVLTEIQEWLTPITGTTDRIKRHMTSEMTAQKVWWISIFWEDNILPALMLMAEQLTAVAMQQMEIVGAFLDAKHQLETQQLLQRIAARTHKDYHPSEGLCEIGSSIKSLASSDRKAEMNAVVMSQRSQDRQLGAINTAGKEGEASDKPSRIKQFREKFCDPADNNNGLKFMCDWDGAGPDTKVGASKPERKNKDIDFVRAVDFPWTLDVDFLGAAATGDPTDNEEEVLALASNLYGHNLFQRFAPGDLDAPAGSTELNDTQKRYLDMRSVVAKSAVAENSYNAIVGMKSAGTPGSREYLIGLMTELGVTQADAEKLIGKNPSYHAQMEVLTKKIYHNPDFYTNLYDKPANVDRKGVALQAIGLMQKFDMFKSYLRNEASLSILLELAVIELQAQVENQINPNTSEGTPAN